MMLLVVVFWQPAALLACKVTLYWPLFVNVFVAFAEKEVLPSPKDH